jgi:hypothetical protein
MEIKKEVTVTLSVKDVEKLIKDHFVETKHIKISSVYFKVGAHDLEGDWRAEFPEVHTLDEVVCKGEELK